MPIIPLLPSRKNGLRHILFGKINISKSEFSEECERYANSIFRYETVADRVYKTHYLMARAYDLCGDNKKSESYLQNLPYVFGFRDY